MNIGSKQRLSLAITNAAGAPLDARGSIRLFLVGPASPPDISPPDISPPDILTASPPDIAPTPFYRYTIEFGFVHDATGFYHYDFALPNDVRAAGQWTLTWDLPSEDAGHLQESLDFTVEALRAA